MFQNGHEIDFTRRRYGKQTFTWIAVRIAGIWQNSGDPVPKIMPSRTDIADAIKRASRQPSTDEKNQPQTAAIQ